MFYSCDKYYKELGIYLFHYFAGFLTMTIFDEQFLEQDQYDLILSFV